MQPATSRKQQAATAFLCSSLAALCTVSRVIITYIINYYTVAAVLQCATVRGARPYALPTHEPQARCSSLGNTQSLAGAAARGALAISLQISDSDDARSDVAAWACVAARSVYRAPARRACAARLHVYMRRRARGRSARLAPRRPGQKEAARAVAHMIFNSDTAIVGGMLLMRAQALMTAGRAMTTAI